MRDFVEAAILVVRSWTGYSIPEFYAPYLVIGAVIIPWLVPIYYTIRRWRGDFRAISDELEAATKVIAGETRQNLDAIVDRLTQHNSTIERSLAQRIDTLQSSLALITEVTAQPKDSEVESENGDSKQSPNTRLQLANEVRNSVIQRWLEGRTLRSTDSDPNCYGFEGTSAVGAKVQIVLSTPYRKKFGVDGRLPFALDVWVDNRKKLNFEWDSEGGYALRGFKRGEWIEDLSLWQLATASEQLSIRAA